MVDRMQRHNGGKEKYAKSGVPWKLLWQVEKATKSQEMIMACKL